MFVVLELLDREICTVTHAHGPYSREDADAKVLALWKENAWENGYIDDEYLESMPDDEDTAFANYQPPALEQDSYERFCAYEEARYDVVPCEA